MTCVIEIISPSPEGQGEGVVTESEDGLCGGSVLQESPSLSEGTASPGNPMGRKPFQVLHSDQLPKVLMVGALGGVRSRPGRVNG